MKFDSQVEKQLYTRFNELDLQVRAQKREFRVRLLRPFTRTYPYDFSIQFNKSQVGIVEVKSKPAITDAVISNIERFASNNDIRLAVVTDGNNFIVTDLARGTARIEHDFDSFVKFLERMPFGDEGHFDISKDEIARYIMEEIHQSELATALADLETDRELISSQLEFNSLKGIYSFERPYDMDSWENKLFRHLLNDSSPPAKIFRYTTIQTVFAMLANNSFRMNCLVGMNDPTEVNYAENYISGREQEYSLFRWQTINAYNRRFISSCSLKEDDLTQWRLYADDSKGVCLVLRIDETRLNGEFIVKRVSYARKDRTHPELELIKNISTGLIKKFGIDFRYKTLGTWRHFFKPYEYREEAEVRVLFIAKSSERRKWALTYSHGILNPYLDFELDDPRLPIRLDGIVLGPNLPFKETNLRQFEELVRENRKTHKSIQPKISISDITIYR